MNSESTALTNKKFIDFQQAVIIFFLMISIAVLDSVLPLGVAGGVPYIVVVLAAYWCTNPKVVVYVSIICSLLVLVGFILSPQGGELWKVVFNRAIAIFAILVTAVLVLKMKKYLDLANTARKEAEISNKAKSIFLSSMSHELRTPMNAIIGFSQILELDLEGEQKRNIQDIINASNHLMLLINEVLDLSGIESGKIIFHMEDHSLHQLLRECLTLMGPQAEKSNISIIDKISDNEDHQINVDSTRFKQIIINMLSNAIKYNQDDGIVTLNCNVSSSHQLRISVTDTGKGLTEEQVNHIFEPFNRAGMESSNITGTGVGLVICEQLAQKMNGSIGVISQPGSGSTFWLEVNLSSNSE